MSYRPPTFAERARQTVHRSFFRERLLRLAGDTPLEDWLVEEANLRGCFGAVTAQLSNRVPCAQLSDAELITALLMPQSVLDVRLFKLVLRLLQQGRVDPTDLWLQARKERAERALYWLLQQVPASERTEPVRAAIAAQPLPPRGYAPLGIDYASTRLLKRPATRESTWRAGRS